MIEQAQRFLTPGFTAGTKAIDNYDECCRLLGFKRSLRRKFGMMQMLYAKNATPEGYSVWMIAHTNLREHFNRDRKWYNKFMSPDLLKEIWFDPTDQEGSLKDTSIRVCFAKARNGSYVFQGVYKPEKIAYEKVDDGQIELVRTFKKYPRYIPWKVKDILKMSMLRTNLTTNICPSNSFNPKRSQLRRSLWSLINVK